MFGCCTAQCELTEFSVSCIALVLQRLHCILLMLSVPAGMFQMPDKSLEDVAGVV